jgi:hypothetical protein
MEELAEINDRIIPVDAVLITTQMKAAFCARFTQVQDAPWQELLDRKPAGFELGTPGHMTYFALAEVCAYPKETAVLFVKKPVVEKGKR